MKTLIIAEAGVNHNGIYENAIKLIDIAAEAGADYVKFQTFKTDLNISKSAKKAKYQQNNTGVEETQYDMVKKLEFSFEQFENLKLYCDEKNIGFLSTAFDFPSIDFIDDLQCIFKVPSGELVNYPYLNKIAEKQKPIILSTGMATLEEIEFATNLLIEKGIERKDITILHCNTEYPTPFEDVNLKAMLTIKEAFDINVGYSDHTLGIEVPVAAVAMGATVIEKHFTLDRNLPGPDHAASLDPHELTNMISSIRNIEKAISGDGTKRPSASEEKNIQIVRKSIHSSKNLAKGHILTEDDLIPLRPAAGISPIYWKDIIGKKLNRDLEQYSSITWSMIDK